ncbi:MULTISPECIES: lipopolysaccharide biosynthesis protein [unclassified Rhodococcus (in: high G+C Gram-positive bacteria)]|uniref:lipopolysaccharide biosynthesis protein n=1 Tax=unclassified Rhodococcus (in: high G+C Gram-positive bacteria) TaxID=192944 RepID=UPI0009EDFE67|nr:MULTISPECIES: lipopolysaccharide biosynthesis protein [unclassified Rhodococcus (in: high G+C Gram-positive bacteria)]
MARLVKQFSWILLGRLMGAVIQAVSMALLARWIGPADFAIFAASYGIALVIQTVGDFGLSAHIVRSRAQNSQDPAAGSALKTLAWINMAICVIGLMAAGAAVAIDPKFLPLVPLAVWLAADKHVEAWLGIPLADGRAWQNATSLVFRRTIALAFLLSSLALGHGELYMYCLGLAVGSMIAAATVQRSNKALVQYGSKTEFRDAFRKSRPFYSNSVATQVRNFDTLLVGLVLSPVASGLYGAASRLTSPLRMVPTSFANILMPIAARQANGGSERILKPILALLGFTTLMYAGIATAIPFVITPLLGKDYDEAIPVIQIVCIGLIFAAVASPVNSLLQGWGHLAAVSWISWFTTGYCLIAILLLGSIFGVSGCGLALATSYVLQVLMQAIYLWKTKGRHQK